jgi:hypothetical protein
MKKKEREREGEEIAQRNVKPETPSLSDFLLRPNYFN